MVSPFQWNPLSSKMLRFTKVNHSIITFLGIIFNIGSMYTKNTGEIMSKVIPIKWILIQHQVFFVYEHWQSTKDLVFKSNFGKILIMHWKSLKEALQTAYLLPLGKWFILLNKLFGPTSIILSRYCWY